jgi:hypothetical protein
MELEKIIDEYPSYAINESGSIFSFFNGKRRELKLVKQTNGYLHVTLYGKEKKRKQFSVHQLMGMAFLGIKSNYKKVILHKDNNKENNKIENLRVGTQSENILQAFREGRATSATTAVKIIQYTLDGCMIKEWDSVTSASKEMKIHQSGISNCLLGKLKKSHGYIWKYK